MSVTHTLLNPQAILNNPLNTSSSKMHYSFSKTRRFNTSVPIFRDVPYYDLPSAKTRRTATFGVGKKITFEDRRVIPASNSYTLESDFTGIKTRKKGFSFGGSKDKMKG